MEPLAALLAGCVLLLVVLGLVVGLFVSRQRTLSARVGSFACSWRPDPDTGPEAPWTVGTAQYCADRLVWWRTLSLAPRPARSWFRNELVILDRLPLDERDDAGRPLLCVRCRHRTQTFALSMSEPALAGLISWLESAPSVAGRGI